MGKKSFITRFLLAASFTTIALSVYQHCGVGDGAGMSNLGSRGNSPNGAPTVSLDSSSVTIPTPSTSLSLAGNCNTGSFANYVFEVNFRVGSTSGITRRYNNYCTAGRFSINVPFGDVGIVAGTPGQLTLSIIGLSSSGEVLGPQAFLSVQWGSGGSSSGTTDGTSTGTTDGSGTGTTDGSGTSGSSSGGTTGCNATCDPDRPCGSTQDSCGGNICTPRHCNTCGSWQGDGTQVTSMSDYRAHTDMNSLGECEADCNSYKTADCCQYDSANRICYVILSGDCRINGGGSSNMRASDCN